MKSKFVSLFQILTVLALLCSLVRLPATQPVAANEAAPSAKETLLVLAVPSLDSFNIPAGLGRLEARDLVREALEKQAQPVLAELRRLQEDGKISAFEPRLEQNAIAVWSEAALPKLETASQLVERSTPSCSQQSLQALEEVIYRRSQVLTIGRQPPSPQETDPSIHVNTYTGQSTYFYGFTAAGVPVNMRLFRNGAEFYADSTTSESDGYYYFSSDWTSTGCGNGEYTWWMQAGDVVEVTANGNTVTTVVSYMNLWMDPNSNVVGGQVDADRTVETSLYWGQEPCNTDYYSMIVTADSWGYFYANFGSLPVDFDGRAYGTVYAIDANGNDTYQFLNAIYLGYAYRYEEAFGMITADTDYTLELWRGGSQVELMQGTSDPGGNFYAYFYDPIPQPGDILYLYSSAVNLSLDLAPLQVTLDHTTDLLSGNTGPGWLVEAEFYKRTSGNIINDCSSEYDCASATADGAGNFSIPTYNIDLQRGDYVYTYAYDTQGNYVYNRNSASVLSYNTNYNEVEGYWRNPDTNLTAILMDSGHNVIDTDNTSSGSSGTFYAYFSQDAIPGDFIQVGDGVITETMTVHDLSGILNSATEMVSGNSAGVQVLAEYYDFNRLDYDDYACYEITPAGGAFSIDLSSMGVEAQDNADVYSRDAEGHFTTAYLNTFLVNVYLSWGEVSGYTTVPETPYTVNLWDGATLLETYSGTSYSSEGYFYTSFTHALDPGLRVEVIDDYQTANITIPVFSINADPLTNSLYGQAPANEPFELELENYFPCYSSYNGWCSLWFYAQAQADGSGNYFQSFAGMFDEDWETGTCHEADVDSWCAEKYLYYYQPDEHQIVYQETLASEPADAYETDDSMAEATLAEGLTKHTFHTEEDVDWFAIPVTADQVGKPLFIHTLLLGPNADTNMTLYDTDGYTYLASDDDSGFGRASFIVWTPPAEGTYYVMVEPIYSYYSVRCGSGYSFLVSNITSRLPFVIR